MREGPLTPGSVLVNQPGSLFPTTWDVGRRLAGPHL